MSQLSFSAYGAVDLSDLGAAPASRPAGQPGSVLVIDVTEGTFQSEVVERSMTTPVVLDFWADWCAPCKQLSPILERLAKADGGRWMLAKIDVDSNQRIAAALGVQGIPAVKAVARGQLVGEFTGALPEPKVRQWLNDLLRVASESGVSGALATDDTEAEAAVDPAHAAARGAIDRGDLDAAAEAYRALMDKNPADTAARQGLARVELLRRVRGVDQRRARRTAADSPGDVAAQTVAADLDVVGGHAEDAFQRLIDTVRRTSGDERDRARRHLLDLFDVAGPDDPRVAKARTALASALF